MTTTLRTLQAALHITVLTGSGISAPSGIPTFRSGPSPLWGQTPETWLVPETFARDPAASWVWHLQRHATMERAQPNAAHRALADLETHLRSLRGTLTVFTQNIDDLHERAGSTNVTHLHGEIARWRCERCGARGRVTDHQPACACGHVPRPDVVWFTEDLPEGVVERAHAAITASDVLLVIGTSLAVSPVNRLPHWALRAGVPVIEINPERTAISRLEGVWHVHNSADAALPELLTHALN